MKTWHRRTVMAFAVGQAAVAGYAAFWLVAGYRLLAVSSWLFGAALVTLRCLVDCCAGPCDGSDD